MKSCDLSESINLLCSLSLYIYTHTHSLTSLLCQLWDLAESWRCGGIRVGEAYLAASLGGGYLHITFDSFLTPTITLFNLLPIA